MERNKSTGKSGDCEREECVELIIKIFQTNIIKPVEKPAFILYRTPVSLFMPLHSYIFNKPPHEV